MLKDPIETEDWVIPGTVCVKPCVGALWFVLEWLQFNRLDPFDHIEELTMVVSRAEVTEMLFRMQQGNAAKPV